MYSDNTKAGISILGALVLGFGLILILSYFHISIRAVVENPDTQDNVHYVGGAGESLWTTYLQKPLSYLWNEIWIPYFWQPFIDTIKKLHDGGSINFGENINPQILPSGDSQ